VWIPELETGSTSSPDIPPSRQRDPVLLTAYLCSSPAAVLKRLKASNAEVDRARALEKGPAAPADSDERSVRRWLSQTGQSSEDLSALWSLRQGQEPPWHEAADEIRRRGDALSRSDLVVSGSDIEALGVRGPRIGRILNQLLQRVLEDPELNNRDALLDLARNME
jgi:tRNA nucleotidyltransferase (CCA-adding enzyme)